VAGVGVAPAQISVQVAGQRGVVRVVGARDHEGAERAELGPRLGPLEGDPVPVQDLPQPFAPGLDRTGGLRTQVVGEFARSTG
jgi:hypothetical protein